MADQLKGKRRRNTVTRLLEDVIDPSAREIDSLKAALDDLTVKVNRLAALHAEARKPAS
ncbi:MAG: hypothetical protein M3357_08370 [Actinomycetota bacterium]|nr:hypothetical protein [Actinomycetota bacterium]